MAKRKKKQEQVPLNQPNKRPKLQNTSSIEINGFAKGMVKDPFPSFEDKQNWFHARNAANNSVDGDLGVIGNEPSNLHCIDTPYTVIGAIHLYGDTWSIFCTDDHNSEIGLFDDSECKYEKLVNAECLNFNRLNLIKGVSKENFDCTWQVYWDDGLNPSRTLNLDDIPWIQIETSPIGAVCVIYEDTTDLDCEKIRLAPLLDTPCVKLSMAEDGGQLRNGTYQAFIAYTVNEQKVTDYIGISNLQSLWTHEDTASSLNINVSNLDKEFDYYELVILVIAAQNTQAKRIGLYSTEQTVINIDIIDNALPQTPLKTIPLQNPAYEKSDSMYVVNDYLIRQGPTEQFDFNYQPLANDITAHWVCTEYEAEYYYKGGNRPTFLRDEQYAFFIRFIYNTGERSSSYHIPGRPPRTSGQDQWGNVINETAPNGTPNSLNPGEMNFEVYNTATETQTGLSIPTEDGGTIISKGDMAYWQSTEKYPATKPDIWNNGTVDLCGKHIRHHKFPTEEKSSNLELSDSNGSNIRILGVEFKNIARPLYNDGTVIPNVIGFEFLRGTREGNKSILGKGIFRNMRKYRIPPGSNNQDTGMQGLYPNYPFNDLGFDMFFINPNSGFNNQSVGKEDFFGSLSAFPPLQGHTDDVFTFHSPELSFRKPFLNAYETRMYGKVSGKSTGSFRSSEKHPQHKLLRNAGIIVAAIFGIGYALEKMRGRKKKVFDPIKTNDIGLSGTLALGSGVIVAPLVGLNTPVAGFTAALSIAADVALDLVVDAAIDTLAFPVDIVTGGFGTTLALASASAISDAVLGFAPGTMGGGKHYEIDGSGLKEVPPLFYAVSSLMMFVQQMTVGTQEIVDLLYNLISKQDFALKYNGHGFYKDYTPISNGALYRVANNSSNYINNTFTSFAQGKYKINNLNRPKTVVVETAKDLPTLTGDTSRFCLGMVATWDSQGNIDVGSSRIKNIAAYYGAIKFNIDNQYGQLEGVRQIPMRGCVELFPKDTPTTQDRYKSDAIFGGDNYVNRFTDKVIMPIFANFQLDTPDETPFDYLKYQNIPLPRYWMDTQKYQVSKIAEGITQFAGGGALSFGSASFGSSVLPSSQFYLDRPAGGDWKPWSVASGGFDKMPLFSMKNSFMYTHINGVQDFFVESEINLAQRDWEDNKLQTFHYDWQQYGEVAPLFNAEWIHYSNYYKYDYSLSAAKFLTNLNSFGNVQPRDYDPKIAETCWSHYPKRLIYSLQAHLDAKKDFWRVYLPANYKDFKSVVNVIKPINQTGAIMLFPYESPKMFKGVDTLKTDLGTKIIIGDGGLFAQVPQNIVNSDVSNEYGSCESARSAINTPLGFFFISQEQGKIFQYGQGLTPISNAGMKWWFNKYLPCQLLKEVPEIEGTLIADNPVIGVGCQSIYDPTDDIVYFCKRDYAVTEEFEGHILYDADEGFQLNLTSYSGQPGVQTCPDGYTFNSSTNKCEKFTYSIPTGSETQDCIWVQYETPCPSSHPEDDPNLIGVNAEGDRQCCLTTSELLCNDGETLMQNQAGQWLCELLHQIDPIIEPRTLNIELTDILYFTDSSWTVSYDPKIKAWISFHDWHPELCLASINHFLTTKSEDLEFECERGYIWNPGNGACEKVVIEEDDIPSEITVLEEAPTGDIIIGCPEDQLIFTKDDDIADLTQNWDRWSVYEPNSAKSDAETTATGTPTTYYTDINPMTGIPSEAVGTYYELLAPGAGGRYLGTASFLCADGVDASTAAGAPANSAQLNEGYFWKNTFYNPPKYMHCKNVRGQGGGNAWRWTTINARENLMTLGNPTASNYLTTTASWSLGNLDNGDYTIDSQGQVILANIKNANFPQKIIMTPNSGLYNGYYSRCEFNDYTHEFTLRSSDNDNDFNGAVLGAFKDTAGVYGPVDFTHQLIMMCRNASANSQTGKGQLKVLFNPAAGAYGFIDPADSNIRQTTIITVDSPFNGGGGSSGAAGPGSYGTQGAVRIKVVKVGSLIDIYISQTMGNQAGADIPPGGQNLDFPAGTPFGTTPVISFDVLDSNTWVDAPGYVTGNELAMFETNTKIGFFTFSQRDSFFYDIAFEGQVATKPGCDCDPGYTKVYKDPATGYYTKPTGTCPGPDQPLICRKIDCNCPLDPFGPGSVLTGTTGTCDDIYAYGDPAYVNTDPKICEYTKEDTDSYHPQLSKGSIWRHNDRCDHFTNYYLVDYPWEVEFIENTGQAVNTLRSIEYQLESFVYKGDLRYGCGDDRWQDLFWNFDEAVIYNSEQVSGLLKLNLQPQLDPITALDYPIINISNIDIIFNKVEQKYRFNQFWDITNDRGEFTNAEQEIWNTQLNGYIKDLNFVNLDYQKPAEQRKKFRHYYNKLILRRSIQGERNRKMLLKVANTKLNLSFR